MLQVVARDADLNRLGVIPYLAVQVVLRHLGVSSWQVSVDGSHAKASLLFAGGGVLIEDDETGLVLSGPTRVIGRQGEDDDPRTTLTVTGVSDDYVAAARLVYPDPSQPATSQTAEAYDVRSGVAETVMKVLVNHNVGDDAIVGRQTPNFTVATDLFRGPSVNSSARFDLLSDVLSALGLAGGLGWQVRQVGSELVFDVYAPTDRSASVRFSRELGNLRGYSYEVSDGDANAVIVAGQGEGTARTFVERTNGAAQTEWGRRVEVFQDRRDTDDVPTLEQAGDTTLVEKGPSTRLGISPVDTPRMAYGVHYGLGDTVTVEVEGASIVDVVSQVNLEAGESGTTVRPVIGDTSGQPGNPRIFQQVSDIARRVGLIERRK